MAKWYGIFCNLCSMLVPFVFQVLGVRYLVPSTWYQVLGTKYSVPSTLYQVLGTKYFVPSTWYQVLGTRVLGTQVLGTKYLGPQNEIVKKSSQILASVPYFLNPGVLDSFKK